MGIYSGPNEPNRTLLLSCKTSTKLPPQHNQRLSQVSQSCGAYKLLASTHDFSNTESSAHLYCVPEIPGVQHWDERQAPQLALGAVDVGIRVGAAQHSICKLQEYVIRTWPSGSTSDLEMAGGTFSSISLPSNDREATFQTF